MTKTPRAQEASLIEDIAEVLLSASEMQARVRDLGTAVSEDYKGKRPLLVGVLKGVTPFMADLMRWITVPSTVDYMAISRYGPQAEALGVVRIVKDLEEGVEGRHVLFVEDIIDTGLTLNYLLKHLRAQRPASLEVCVLFNKPARRLIDHDLRYKGFDLPDAFVVGYGLDYDERYRNLPFVGILKPDVYIPEEPIVP